MSSKILHMISVLLANIEGNIDVKQGISTGSISVNIPVITETAFKENSSLEEQALAGELTRLIAQLDQADIRITIDAGVVDIKHNINVIKVVKVLMALKKIEEDIKKLGQRTVSIKTK